MYSATTTSRWSTMFSEIQRGMNLRNDVAHGTVQAAALSPERILLIWLFMIRLSLMDHLRTTRRRRNSRRTPRLGNRCRKT